MLARKVRLGPGLRAVVWVQGCPFNCPSCIAPEWIPDLTARLMRPAELATRLLARPDVAGFTFSGGEPMRQAAGLARVIGLARRERDVSLVCFTGYRLERLRARPPGPGVAALLAEVDVLIDGLYVAELNDDRGLRGSTNQRVHHLTDRLASVDFERAPRSAELTFGTSNLFLVGVPPVALAAAMRSPAAPARVSPGSDVH